MTSKREKSWIERIGAQVSEWVADIAAQPYAQIAVIVVCAAWFIIGFATDLLTAILSIMAITLTQMVLYNQAQREMDVHRRDVAMHAKLDELIAVSRRAKNEFVGIEDRDEDEIVQLKEEVREAIAEQTEHASPEVRERAKQAIEEAADDIDRKHGGRSARKPASR